MSVCLAALARLACVAALLSLASCEREPGPKPQPEPARAPAARPAQGDDGKLAGLDYVEVMTGGAQPSEAVPVIIALHGLGDRPEAFAPLFRGLPARARVVVPRAIDAYSQGFSWFALDDRSDQGRAEGVRRAAERVAQLAAELAAKKPARGKPIVTGFSQGGMLSFELAVHHGERFSAAFPVSGWMPPPLLPAERPASAARIVALHGEADQRLPLGPTREGVEKLRAVGLSVELKTYPGTGHTVSAEMRRDLYELLARAVEQASSGLPEGNSRMAKKAKIGIVSGDFHQELCEAMVASAAAEAKRHGAEVIADIRVSGSYEVPLMVEALCARGRVDVVVVLGYIERGETLHGEVMGQVVHQALMKLSLHYKKPIGIGIIGPGATREQAEVRKVPYAAAAVQAALRSLEALEIARA